MVKFSDFHINNATMDKAVGISIQNLLKGQEQNLYATVIEAGNKVGCHCHHEGEEWYIILSGEGSVFTSKVINCTLSDITKTAFKAGSTFCIAPETAHQLVAHTRVELIFLCPPAHLDHDRLSYENIC